MPTRNFQSGTFQEAASLSPTTETIADAERALARLDAVARRFALTPIDVMVPVRRSEYDLVGRHADVVASFEALVDDDLNTPSAVALLFDLATRANTLADAGDLDGAKGIAELLAVLAASLGLALRVRTSRSTSLPRRWRRHATWRGREATSPRRTGSETSWSNSDSWSRTLRRARGSAAPEPLRAGAAHSLPLGNIGDPPECGHRRDRPGGTMPEFSLELNEDQTTLKDWVHEFAERVVRPVASEWDEREETPWPVIEEAAKVGIYDLDFVATTFADPTGLSMALTFEEMSWGDAGICLAIFGSTLAVSGIMNAGTPEQAMEWIPQCFGTPGDLKLAAFGVSEPDAGSDVSSLRRARPTTRRRTPGRSTGRRPGSPTAGSRTCT